MARAMPLPKALQYLEPFARSLSKLPPDELNEDVDGTELEAALRKRLGGLEEDVAAAELSRDRALLEHWLRTSASPDHPGYWILGWLSLPNLAELLNQPSESLPSAPVMSFDPPKGWKVTVVPFRLDLKKGKIIGTIEAIDEFWFEERQQDIEEWSAPSGLQATWETENFSSGHVVGKKYVFRQIGPAWKRVDYVLKVPGGFVSAMLDGMGADFDEGPLESKLHTLRLSGSV
jgi:hypothetical protein